MTKLSKLFIKKYDDSYYVILWSPGYMGGGTTERFSSYQKARQCYLNLRNWLDYHGVKYD